MKANRLSILATLPLATLLSCSPKIEPMLSTYGSIQKANFIFLAVDKDFDSAYTFPDHNTDLNDENRIFLFPKSSGSITYLLNGRPTSDRSAIKNAFHKQKVSEVLIGMSAQNKLELVSIQSE